MGELRPDFELVPDREGFTGAFPPRYRIERTLGAGGFGLTYLATKSALDSSASVDPSRLLWLPEGARVAIKEFYPEQFATRHGHDPEVHRHDDEERAEHFDRFFERFRKEAERLFLLTCLRALRAVNATYAAEGDSDQPLCDEIAKFLSRVGQDETTDMESDALDLIANFNPIMRRLAEHSFKTSPLPVVYDYFQANGTLYYVMEYLDGGTLKDAISKSRSGPVTMATPWSYADFAPFARKVLDGMDELHCSIPGHPLIHCDIKPGNVMFRGGSPPQPVLIDVGLARGMDSESQVPAFTFRYAAQELQKEVERIAAGGGRLGEIGPWTDIYAMAIVFTELSTTEKSSTVTAMIQRGGAALQQVMQFPNDYPAGFRNALLRALQNDYRKRPKNVSQWCRELLPATNKPEPVEPPHDIKPRVPQRVVPDRVLNGMSWRKRLLLASAVAALIIGVIGGFFQLRGSGANKTISQKPRENMSGNNIPSNLPNEPAPKPGPPRHEDGPKHEDHGNKEPVELKPLPPASTPSAKSTALQQFALFGLEARPIVNPDAVAALARSSGGKAVGAFQVWNATAGGAAANAGLSNNVRIARACNGGSALDEIKTGQRTGTACIIGSAGQRIRLSTATDKSSSREPAPKRA